VRAAGPHIQLTAVTKRYGATVAVADATLTIERGAVHALVGENGAGKSTLGKIVAGVTGPDRGTVAVDGKNVSFRSPRDALSNGITSVAQELALVPSATALENVFLGIEKTVGPFVARAHLRRSFDEIVSRTGIGVPPDVPVKDLPVADQQKVEILRALVREAQLIVMDEPTARLSAAESATLCALIRRLSASGITVVFVSHHLDEVLATADTVTIMRDGRVVRSGPTSAESHDSLIRAMIGRSLERTYPARATTTAVREVLRVQSLSRKPAFQNVSFSVAAGEIVVLAGLVGSGRTDVARAIFGVDRIDSGQVWLNGRELTNCGVGERIKRGVAMIPESRRDQGILSLRSVRENVTLASLRWFSRWGFMRKGKEKEVVAGQATRVGVRAASIEMPVGQLSGGNQQKVLFARWLLDRPNVLIADEPTRGVDVGSKHAIYVLLADLAREGMAVVVISSELDEVVGLAHRVIVMREGGIVRELTGEQIREDLVMQAAFGSATGSGV
jgi:simple sugar transport system ATP-binding protein/ribose transport system ATP-binding protein